MKQETLEEVKPKDIQRIISSTDAQTASIEIVTLFTKLQQEQMYSEEEVKEILKMYRDSIIEVNPIDIVYLEKWFENYKKK
jgi:hypothetical protein